MKLTEYEVLIKTLVKKNPQDPEIYNNLQKMIEMFLRRKKVCNCRKDYEDLSYVLAGDMFMKIYQGDKIDYYLGYLEKVYRPYAHRYYDENDVERINVEDVTDRDSYKRSLYGSNDYDTIISKLFLEEMEDIINEVMLQSCKYDPSGPAFLNLKLSLVLSLIKGEEVYYNLSPDQKFYLKLIIANFHNKIIKEGLLK